MLFLEYSFLASGSHITLHISDQWLSRPNTQGSHITLHISDQWLSRPNTHLFWCVWLEYDADQLVGLSKCDKLFLPYCFSSSEILLKLLFGIIQLSRARNSSLISHKISRSKSHISLIKFLVIIHLSW